LQDSNLITDTREHVLSGIETFIALIEGTDVVYLITPFYSLDFVTRLDVFASKDIEWHLIVTEEVIRRALMDAENRNVKAILRGEGEIRVIRQDPKLFFVSTGDEIALALAYVTGQLDYSTLLVSRGSDAITWGTGLFSYYNNRSEPVVLQ
jgi:predicted transcriptional regulator